MKPHDRSDNVARPAPRFRVAKLEERIAPKILQVNGGGNIPNGSANGVPSSNPAGSEPPGHNK